MVAPELRVCQSRVAKKEGRNRTRQVVKDDEGMEVVERRNGEEKDIW